MSARKPRFRYIAFRIATSQPLTWEQVSGAVRSAAPSARLVELRGAAGLVSCRHVEKDATIRALIAIVRIAGESVQVTTLGTSGTIRRATQKYLD